MLFRLWNAGENNQQTILDFIQSLPEQAISGLDFLVGPRDEVMVRLTETFGNIERPCEAALLSDGTLRVLAIAAAMLHSCGEKAEGKGLVGSFAGLSRMSGICLIDTSIFLNLLDVPNRNESKETVASDFTTYAEAGCTFLLPMVTIVETGNHIAQNGDGNTRRITAQKFIIAVKAAFSGEAPWQPLVFPVAQDILSWIDEFPDFAGRNKSPDKPEGTSFGDFSIIQEFHKACKRFPMSEVFI